MEVARVTTHSAPVVGTRLIINVDFLGSDLCKGDIGELTDTRVTYDMSRAFRLLIFRTGRHVWVREKFTAVYGDPLTQNWTGWRTLE